MFDFPATGLNSPDKMRIIYHHRTRFTDAQRVHILEIIEALRSLGHEVEVASLVPPETGEGNARRDAEEARWKKWVRRIPLGYEIVQLGYNVVGLPMLVRKLLRRHADFIYERYSLFNFTGVIAARLFRIPLILEVNSPFALEQQRDRDIRAVAFAGWTERVICNSAAKVIVVSDVLRKILIASGISAEKIVVMPNGVNLDHFKPRHGSQELRNKLGLKGKVVVGFVGWFRNWHRLDLLLEAFRKGNMADNGARLLLIGDGPAMAELQDYVNTNHLQDFVIFTGPLPHDTVPAYVDIIDIAAQPAANEYCCPMKILEYMAMAKPIVAPHQQNILELLSEGEGATFFTPGSADSLAVALKQLVISPELAHTIGQRGLARIHDQGLLWSSNASRIVDLVSRVRGGSDAAS